MNRAFIVLLFGAAACVTASAQTPNAGAQAAGQASARAITPQAQASGSASASSTASANPSDVNAGLASGTAFHTSLSKSVDAKHAKAGDAIEARTTEAVKEDKKTVLPKGTKLVGHVTQASARVKGESQSALGIAFDRAILKDGTEIPLNVAVQALASSNSAASVTPAEVDSMANAGPSTGTSGGARGMVGGTGPATGGVVNTAGNTTGNVVNTAGAATHTAANSTANLAGTAQGAAGGLNAAGQLTSNSRGVFGLSGLNLNSAASTATQGSVITSADKNIHLDSGTQMLLVTQATTSSNP